MEKIKLKSTNWRDFIPPADCARRLELAQSDTYQWAEHRCAEPFVANWRKTWQRLHQEPYKGITNDGHLMPNVHHLARTSDDHGAPTTQMVQAALKLISVANPEQRRNLQILDVDAPEWRAWMNPEIYISRHGVRLEESSDAFVEAVHNLMHASLSEAGYQKAYGCMKVNHYLGQVVNGEKVLNERSYNITIFGTPSETEPWGWQLFGHHFDMNCFVLKSQMVVTPVFMGAEPNVIDDGPYAGTELFTDQEQTALALINSIAQENSHEVTIDQVRVYSELQGPEYPEWRYHPADQRHLGGAFHDNRIIPYEGVKVNALSVSLQHLVRHLISLSVNYLPDRAHAARMKEIEAYWAETYFCWIGALTRDDGFYYKIHSPVVMVEFDHHSGVFLNNALPLPFHIHTLVRTPQGNDYGKALLSQYRQNQS
ncbi:uncharacterized protein A1O9_09165 [Exophiala aquamarina CBS 119918]|uniref:DUF3500 domain-containing protein n=1 Tax=Exophiala aquamarina CBS 119918 TaxID=1182545 RepID=A0A072P620_9EURO|nr:uncharacterized protein A1O9_09165 [Exophiala aquamarina CBS 119918]KEF54723.1 hypothetical protein A1O9_09165 [Exophiala aquamarina CBS 119918]